MNQEILTKKCKHCQQIKLLTEFYFRPKQKIYNPYCRSCVTIRAKIRYNKTQKTPRKPTKIIHTEEEKKFARKLHNEGKSYRSIAKLLNIRPSLVIYWCDSEYRKRSNIASKKANIEWYADPKNKTHKAEYFQKRMKECPKKVYEIQRRSRFKNKTKTLEKNRIKYHNDPVSKIKGIQRQRIRKILFENSIIKNKHIDEYLGCTGFELKEHLEKQFTKGMTWQNHGKYGWHVDHIQPLHVFDIRDSEQSKIAFWYTNLQPLWWYDNLSKNKGIRFENNK